MHSACQRESCCFWAVLQNHDAQVLRLGRGDAACAWLRLHLKRPRVAHRVAAGMVRFAQGLSCLGSASK
jgi:hypothetical protein